MRLKWLSPSHAGRGQPPAKLLAAVLAHKPLDLISTVLPAHFGANWPGMASLMTVVPGPFYLDP